MMAQAMMSNVNHKLCDRVIRALGRHTDPLDALNVLADALGFQLSVIACPNCRAEAARMFAQSIPNILAHANELAADYAAAGAETPSVHVCH
jgi:hypothetical protein